MGMILPMLAAFLLAVGLAWVFGKGRGPGAFGKAVRRGGGGVLLAIGAALTLTGRFAIGIPLIGIGLSILKPGMLERGGWFPGRGGPFSGGLGGGPWIGEGRVLKGRLAGRSLDSLDGNELGVLYAEVSGRPADRSVLEAHLDRRMPGWRENVKGDAAGGSRGPTRPGAMTDQQAYQILGLSPGATEAEISAAYRRLMKGVHPDQGGSTFLAAQINEAKERLLGRHR